MNGGEIPCQEGLGGFSQLALGLILGVDDGFDAVVRQLLGDYPFEVLQEGERVPTGPLGDIFTYIREFAKGVIVALW